jgi:hypothetical protein
MSEHRAHRRALVRRSDNRWIDQLGNRTYVPNGYAQPASVGGPPRGFTGGRRPLSATMAQNLCEETDISDSKTDAKNLLACNVQSHTPCSYRQRYTQSHLEPASGAVHQHKCDLARLAIFENLLPWGHSSHQFQHQIKIASLQQFMGSSPHINIEH